MSDVGVPSERDFLTLTSDSNCRGTSLVVTSQLKKKEKVKCNLLAIRPTGLRVDEKAHLVGPPGE